MKEGLHADLTERIIGAAMEVHRTLGPGLDEKIYETALCVELGIQRLHFDQQKRHAVFYKNRPVGTAITDLIVDDRVVVETKSVDTFHESHSAQLLSYLRLTGLQVGLLLNFKNYSLQFKRTVLSKPRLESAESSVNPLNLRSENTTPTER
jgi:GxxExxY protein